jgi:hypothetical protein
LARATGLCNSNEGRWLALAIESMAGANDGFVRVSDALALGNASFVGATEGAREPGALESQAGWGQRRVWPVGGVRRDFWAGC